MSASAAAQLRPRIGVAFGGGSAKRIAHVGVIRWFEERVPARADVSSDEANRLSAAATAIHELRASPDKGVPEDLFKKAACVAVIPELKKAAFLIGGEYGKDVVSCRTGQTWSAPAFLTIEKGSAGLQIGGEQTDLRPHLAKPWRICR